MKDSLKFPIFVLIGSICFMLEALYNGFPLVYSDTSTYLASGFELETPFDRPITYGIFLRVASLNGLSLWLVIFAQALMVSFLIFCTTKLIFGEKSYKKTGLAVILFLSLFTGLSWTICQLIPDVFTPIAILCMILILLGRCSTRKNLFLYILFTFSVATHLSHILLFVILLLLITFLKNYLLPLSTYPNRARQLLTLSVLSILPVLIMGSALSKSKHIFFMGAMVEHGIAKTYLDDHCSEKQYQLCAYKDSLPDKAYQFVWDEASPLYKMGGWKETKSEFNEIISATLTQPKYIKLHIRESLKATYQQILRFGIGDGNGSFLEGTVLHERISKFAPNDLSLYSTSRQSESKLKFLDFKNKMLNAVVIICMLALCLFLVLRKINKPHLLSLTVITFLSILINAWDCGTFANAIDRLGCKTMWMIPMICLLASLQWVGKKVKA